MSAPSIPNTPAERFHAIDALRALAMFLGVVLHSSLGYMGEDVGFTPKMDRSRFVLFDLGVYGVHAFRMQLFFVVAGFFTALLLSKRGPGEFVRGRLVRLGLPLLFGCLIIVPLTLWPFLRAKGVEPTAWLLYAKPAHLWFLIYLSIFSGFLCLMVVAAQSIGRAMLAPVLHVLAGWADSPCGVLLLAAPTVLLTMLMPSWVIETPWQWMPRYETLLYYGFFFAVGWGAQRRGVILSMGRSWKWVLPIAVLVLFPAMVWVGRQYPASEAHVTGRTMEQQFGIVVAATIQALFTWGMILGLFGLFVTMCEKNRAWVRWLADSSYWVYLLHLPTVYWLQYAMADFAVPGLSAGPAEACLKFAMILGLVTAFTLGTYAVLVRPTALERVVGGAGGANRSLRPGGAGVR